MGLFKLFSKKNQELPAETINNLVEIPKDLFIDESEPTANTAGLMPFNGTLGIDSIYAFLQNDYESRGYNDALTNPDDGYRSDNINLLRQDLSIMIDRSSTYYEDHLKEVDFHINSRSRAGLVDTVEELKTRRATVVEHIEKIRAIKEDAIKCNGTTQRIELSYQRGFMRGLAALTQSNVLNKKL